MARQFGKENEILYAESTCLGMLNGPTISFIASSQVKLLFIEETANLEKHLHSRKAIYNPWLANFAKKRKFYMQRVIA